MVTALLSAITVKFVALGLSKDLAGAYNSTYGYLQIFAILADFGLYAVSVKEVSRATDRPRVLGALLTLRVGITVLSLGSAVAIAMLVPAWHETPLRTGVAVAAFVPFFTLLAGVLRTVFQVTYRMEYVFIAEVSNRVLTALLMAGVIVAGIRGSDDPSVYSAFLWIGAAGALLLFVLSLCFARGLMRIRPCVDRALLWRLLVDAAPYGVAFLCIALYRQFDLTMIALLRPDFRALNAEYGFALRITEMTYLVPTFLLNSTLPVLSERAARGQDTATLLGKTFVTILLLGAVSALFSALWARPIMALLTTDAYLAMPGASGADTALRLLALPMFLNGLVLFSFYTLLTLHRWRPLVVSMLLGALLSFVSNLFLIPAHGFVGAIVTASCVHAFLALLLVPRALRAMPITLPSSLLVRSLAFLVSLGVFLWLSAVFLHDMAMTLIGCLIGLGVTVGLAWAWGILRFLRGAR